MDTAILICVAILSGVSVWQIVKPYVVPPKWLRELAEYCGVPRQKKESISSWQKRVLAAQEERSAAEHAFADEAYRLGNVEISGRAVKYWLPPEHPMAIRLATLKGGRGDHTAR